MIAAASPNVSRVQLGVRQAATGRKAISNQGFASDSAIWKSILLASVTR
jgi:hypothetical protein